MSTQNEFPTIKFVGRIVQGDPNKPRTTDKEGNKLVIKRGPNAGQPRVDWYLGIAIPKNTPETNNFFKELTAAAIKISPRKIDSWGNDVTPDKNYAWKYIDGDTLSDRTGHAGHWIIKTSTGYRPRWYRFENGSYLQIDPSEMKRGYYVQVSVTVKDNESNSRPGLILNPNGICFLGYGEEIFVGPSPDEMFDNNIPLPPGASATPIAPPAAGGGVPGQPGAGGYPPATGGVPGQPGAGGYPPATGGIPGQPGAGGYPPATGGVPGQPGAGGYPPATGGIPGQPGAGGYPPATGGVPRQPGQIAPDPRILYPPGTGGDAPF